MTNTPKIPRVLLIGVTGWHGQFTESCQNALRLLNIPHETAETADYGAVYHLSFWGKVRNRLLPHIRATSAEYPGKIRQLLEKASGDFDLVLLIGGQHLTAKTIRQLRQKVRGQLAIWFYDDPFMFWEPPLVREGLLDARDCFDQTFVFDSYHLPKLEAYGFKNPSLLPLCADETIYHPGTLSEEEQKRYGAEVSFIGLPTPNREAALKQCLSFNLKLFGPRWNDPRLNERLTQGHFTPQEVVKIYRATQIAININHPQSIYGSNCRTYEIASAGCAVLTDRKADLEKQFVENEEILFYDTLQEIPEKLRTALANPVKLAQLREAGQRRALEHSFRARLKTLLAACGFPGQEIP